MLLCPGWQHVEARRRSILTPHGENTPLKEKTKPSDIEKARGLMCANFSTCALRRRNEKHRVNCGQYADRADQFARSRDRILSTCTPSHARPSPVKKDIKSGTGSSAASIGCLRPVCGIWLHQFFFAAKTDFSDDD